MPPVPPVPPSPEEEDELLLELLVDVVVFGTEGSAQPPHAAAPQASESVKNRYLWIVAERLMDCS